MTKKTTPYLFIALSFFLFSTNVFAQKKAKKNKNKFIVTEENLIKSERLFFDAQKEKIKENYILAQKNFEQALKFNPKIDAAWYEIAIINTRQKDYASALANIENALEISPKNKFYREFFGEMLSANAEFNKASGVFKSLKEDYPNNPDYYYNEAFLLLKQNKVKDALKVYNELESRIGIQEELSNQKFKLHLEQSNSTAAEKELQNLIDSDPNNLVYLNRLAQFYSSNKQEEKAVATHNKILEIDPDNTLALISLADYYKVKGDKEKYDYYSKKAFSNPSLGVDAKIAILYNYIELYQRKLIPNLDDAFEYAILLKETHPEDAKSWAISGDLFYLSEKLEEALVDYKKSLTLQQDVFTVWQQVFFIASDLKKYQELAEETQKAKEFFPNQSMVYFFSGFALQQLKDYSKAVKAYETGSKMAVGLPSLQAQFFSNLGESYNSLKNYEKSDEYFEKSLKIEPNNQYVLNNYAYYLSLRVEKLDLAKEMSAKSLEISKDNPTYLDTYAWVLYQSKNYKEALKIQEKAIQLSEDPSAEMYDHLGDMYFKLGQKEDANLNWEKAKAAGGDADEINKKITNGLKENK